MRKVSYFNALPDQGCEHKTAEKRSFVLHCAKNPLMKTDSTVVDTCESNAAPSKKCANTTIRTNSKALIRGYEELGILRSFYKALLVDRDRSEKFFFQLDIRF